MRIGQDREIINAIYGKLREVDELMQQLTTGFTFTPKSAERLPPISDNPGVIAQIVNQRTASGTPLVQVASAIPAESKLPKTPVMPPASTPAPAEETPPLEWTPAQKKAANDWWKRIPNLPVDDPGPWNDHYTQLGELTGLATHVENHMRDNFIGVATRHSIGFDEDMHVFFLPTTAQTQTS